jgi:hypothetical protein
MWEAGAIEQVELPDPAGVDAKVKDRPDLEEQLDELRECAYESVRHVAEAVRESVGMGIGVEALSQWEGFGRFCRDALRVEPMTLLAAYSLGRDDPAEDVLAVYPDAKADEAKAARWAGNWNAWEWERRFGT